ncbi:MAG: HDOD domain-containing protein [Alteromonadaceae bacterium]|nr:HDOD domain-containing protein [Alteromonadaceae bacterium]
MINTYIARQAILDRNSETIGYELLFRDSVDNKFPELDSCIATSKLIIQNHIHGDIEAISMGKLAFVNFTERCLINKFPLMFDKKSVVIELVGYKTVSPRLLKIVKFYHGKGYLIALTEYDLDEKWDVLFPYLHMIKIDIDVINAKRIAPIVKKIKPFNIKLVAEKVETNFQLQSLTEVGFNYYQGFFYHKPEIVEGTTLSPVKMQMLQLISETFNAPLNFQDIADIISRDINLIVGLLKIVNNVSTSATVEITSLKQAATYLGEEKLRQFISILALSKLTTSHDSEIFKQALLTAKLMTSISAKGAFREINDYAFITGLLSSIEVILSMPITEIVKTMPLAKPVEIALVQHEGLLGELLNLTINYITGQGDDVKELIEQYSISPEFIQQEFIAASKWCYEMSY